MQLKTQLEETRHQLQTSKNTHLRQIEQMEVNILFFLVYNINLFPLINKRKT